MSTPLKPPSGMGSKARDMWNKVSDSYELRADELRILEDACREMDLVDRLEKELRDSTLVVNGSQGQPVANPLVQEVRQHRAVLMRLFAALRLPEDAEAEAGRRSAQMRAVVNARWNRGA